MAQAVITNSDIKNCDPTCPLFGIAQGREQLHALIEKCSYSLRLMSYGHFMKVMQIFFAVKNLQL